MDMVVHNIKVTSKHVTLKLELETGRRLMHWLEALHSSEIKDIDNAAKKLTELLALPCPSSEPDDDGKRQQRACDHHAKIRRRRHELMWSSVRADELSDFLGDALCFWNWDAE